MMDEKTHSRRSSRHAGKSSSSQNSNNRCLMVDNLACQSPSRLFSTHGDHQKPLPSKTNQSLPQKRIIAEKTNRTVKNNSPRITPKQLETSNSMTTPKTAKVHEAPSFLDADSANHRSSIEDREQIRREPGYRSLYAPTFSFTQRLIASRDTKKATKNCSQGAKTGTKNWDSKRNSSSISNVIPTACSPSVSSPNRRETSTIPRSFSTSSKRKLSGALDASLCNSSTPNSSRIMNKSVIDHLGMIKPLKHSDRGTTMRRQARGIPGSSRSPDSELDYSSSSKNFWCCSASGPLNSSPERGKMLSFYDHSSNTDVHMHNKTEGVAEEPERIENEQVEEPERIDYERDEESERIENEQDEDMLEYESIFFYYDEHRDMRMDIDGMSYEELLALSEKMGSVSTGLTDEALEKCLQRSNFKLPISSSGDIELIEDGNRCSICQQEFDDGEEIGAPACEHWFHVDCIQYWLTQKNWCPICKAPASADRQVMAS